MKGNDRGNSNLAIVVIFVLALVAAGAAFFLWRGGYFGGQKSGVDVEVKIPGTSAPGKPY